MSPRNKTVLLFVMAAALASCSKTKVESGTAGDGSAAAGPSEAGQAESGGSDAGARADSASGRADGAADSGRAGSGDGAAVEAAIEAAAGSDSAAAGDAGGGGCGNQPGQLFPPGAPWNTSIAGAQLDSESSAIIDYLQTNHTTSSRFQIDFSFNLLKADAQTAHLSFTPTEDFYSGECDTAAPPVPDGGALEGESGYQCASDGDCHLLVVDQAECRLFEMWRANIDRGVFYGGCQAVWDLTRVYPATGRGDQCTSADAAGLPIAPLLFSADEVFAGEIRHAIRFILPNENIRAGVYVHPATHSTSATGGPAAAPPYGARLRLKSGADLSGLKPAARVVARALQSYGMFLADGGNITFTADGDAFTEHSWSEVDLGPHDLKPLQWSDFEVVNGGARITYTGDCQYTPIEK